MPHRGDCKHTALLTNTGEVTGHVDDLEQLWLETQTGSTGNVNDLWMEVFLANGATSGDFNTAAYEFLLGIGTTAAALPDMWTEFWCVFGGIITPAAPAYPYEVELGAGIVNYEVDLAATVDYEINITITSNVIDGLDNVVDGADNVVDTI
jgi:hypothetical protein